MSTETLINTKGVYFITFTCHDWLPLIRKTDAYNDVYHFLDVLQSKGHKIVGYVIMPNHIHLLLHYTSTKQTLNVLIGGLKRFIAYSIIKKLEQMGETTLLRRLQEAVEAKDRERGKKHEVWRPGFDVKECRTEKFLLQKINYIHDNPISGKWKLAERREDYPHTSCLFYFTGKQRQLQVTHYEQVLDWENMYPEAREFLR